MAPSTHTLEYGADTSEMTPVRYPLPTTNTMASASSSARPILLTGTALATWAKSTLLQFIWMLVPPGHVDHPWRVRIDPDRATLHPKSATAVGSTQPQVSEP